MNEPVRPPRRRRRPDWVPRFIEIIRATANVRLAADAAGVDRSTPYARAERDPVFATAWAQAREDAIDVLEGEARRRALEGSDSLMALQLRAYRPQIYRESFDIRLDIRREAGRVAAKTGRTIDEVLEAANRRAAELERR